MAALPPRAAALLAALLLAAPPGAAVPRPAAGVRLVAPGPSPAGAAGPPHRGRRRSGVLVVDPRLIRVHDGDTFYVGAETFRLRGIDTPELGHPRAEAARRRLAALLASGPVTIVRRAEDVYGRTVADVCVGGRDVAAVLRREGFVKPGTGRRLVDRRSLVCHPP